MTDIPDHLVGGRVEHVMQGDGQFDHTEARAEMATGHRNGVDQLLAQLFGELRQISLGQLAKVGREAYLVQQGRTIATPMRIASLGSGSIAFLRQRRDPFWALSKGFAQAGDYRPRPHCY